MILAHDKMLFVCAKNIGAYNRIINPKPLLPLHVIYGTNQAAQLDEDRTKKHNLPKKNLLGRSVENNILFYYLIIQQTLLS